MAIAKIVIENFRGIKSLALKDLPQVVLLGGRNGCGKTSVLEAIALFVAPRRTQGVLVANQMRWYPAQTIESLKSVFFGSDVSKEIKLTGELSEDSSQLLRSWCVRYNIVERNAFNYSTDTEKGVKLDADSRKLVAETGVFQDGEWVPYSRDQSIDCGSGEWRIEKTVLEKDVSVEVSSAFLSSSIISAIEFDTLKSAIVQGGGAIITDALKRIDSRIKGLQLVDDRAMVELDGFTQLLPLQSLGDGLQKIVRILAFLYLVRDGGILCIDELGNGLHYSACRVVWDAILSFVRQYKGVQVFITTHWNEILTSAVVAYENLREQKNFCYINLVKNNESGSIDPVRYDFATLKTALELGMEVR